MLLQQKNASLASRQLKQEKLIVDLQADLSHELELRTRLEESQRALTQHVHEMEVAVEVEKEQVCHDHSFSPLVTCGVAVCRRGL